MQRRAMIAVIALLFGSSMILGTAFAQGNTTSAAIPSDAQRLGPKVERLARELGVTLDARSAIDPRASLRRLLRPLDEAVNRIDFGPEDSMMELVLRGFVAELRGFAANPGTWNGRVTAATERVGKALNGVTSILIERSPRGRVHARSDGSAVATVGTGSISGTVTTHGTPAVIPDVVVRVFDSSGVYVSQGTTDAAGTYTVGGLGPGRYFAVTENSIEVYIDEVYLDRVCLNSWSCGVTLGTPIAVTDGVDTPGIDFGLVLGGTITGKVWEDVTFVGLSTGITVAAYDVHGYVASTATPSASSSTYNVFGLPTGDYYVGASDATRAHVAEFHDDIPTAGVWKDIFKGTTVPVTVGGSPAFVNFILPLAGSIEGDVTEHGTGTPITNPIAVVYEADGTPVGAVSGTGAGAYTVAGLPSGSYFLTCSGPTPTYVRELWDDSPCVFCDVTTGTPIVVTQPSSTAGVDFALVQGGRILGTVTAEGSGTPLEGVVVYVFHASGPVVDQAISAADGSYATYGSLSTGSYYVGAFDVTGEFISEVYLDTPCVGCVPTIGTLVGVTAGEDTTGIDFSLVPGGRIAGTVTIEDWGDPLNGGVVHVFDSIGNEIGGGSPWGGAYQTLGLPTGTYYAAAVGPTAGVGLQSELFDDMACPFASCSPITGTEIGVTAPGTTTNVDFNLPLGARIAGFVQDAAGGVPLFNMTVDVFDSAGTFVVTGTTDPYGDFATEGLANGTYYALAEDNTGAGHASQLYDNIPCDGCDVTTGTPIVISSTDPYEGVDFSLSVPGECSGETHLDLASTSPVSGTETYEACETITAGGTFGVQSPGDVDFRAGVQIILTDGFFVESGAAVTFEIDPALLP